MTAVYLDRVFCYTKASYKNIPWTPKPKLTLLSSENITFHERIGNGATSDVFHVSIRTSDGTIEAAAKRMFKLVPEKAFLKEALQLQTLSQENIIRYFGVTSKKPFLIVTELATNGSLYEYLRHHQSIQSDLILLWSKNAANAVKYLHGLDLVHGDVKSPNFLISAENTLKLCDFGMCMRIGKTPVKSGDRGTTRWSAPEVYSECITSKASDIFSLGILFWELWTCEVPYADKTSTQIMWAVVMENERPPIPDRVHELFRDLMRKCWERDYKLRPDIGEVVSALAEYE